MANGEAVVVSDIPQNREIISNNRNGIIFDTDSPEDLADKLMELIDNKELIMKLGKNAQQTISDLGLTWENSAKKHIEFYKKIIETK